VNTRILLHIHVLGRLHVVAGWLALLAATSLALLGIGAVSLTSRTGPEVAAGLAAAIFFACAAAALAWGAVLIGIGWALPQHQPWARPAALVLAIVNVFVIPFGTALSGYAFWVLLQEAGKRAFERPHLEHSGV
jgi:hypothetical protein